MRYAFIADHHRQFPVRLMCRVLEVEASGYCACGIASQVRTRCERCIWSSRFARFMCGATATTVGRVHHELIAQGVKVSENTVAKLMNRRRFKLSTTDSNHGWAVEGNMLERRFTLAGLN
jgi:putative transposase